jgi:5-methylcytosine-specific restriction enzyme subunit McrC
MSRTIQVFEHERLTLHKNQWGQCLTESELQKLYTYNDRHDNRYFTGIRDGVKFKSYVGVIQIGGLTLEILPKADRYTSPTKETHAQEANKWHNALLRMLAVTRYISVESVSEASLERKHHSILDLYFVLFLNEVENLLHRGLVKRYRKTEGNLPVLKGRLNFSHNIQQNLIHQERFYTDHQVYDQDHLINQILYCALVILNRIAASPFIKDRLARIRLDFPEMAQIAIQAHHFERISESRKTVHYREALQIARMIILNYSPDIKGGSEDMLALLFDMNKLWEEYIYRVLVRAKPDELKVSFQNSKTFWQTAHISKTIRPDLVITRGDETFIIDTKWKVIDSLKPDDDDLKQVFSYNLYWKSYHSILLYPGTSISSQLMPGKYKEGLTKEHGCTLAFVEVLNEAGGLNKQCGQSILNLLYAHST